jgi:hypothetical protein
LRKAKQKGTLVNKSGQIEMLGCVGTKIDPELAFNQPLSRDYACFNPP